MNWLITGGCGLIVRARASLLIAEGGQEVSLSDSRSTRTREDLASVGSYNELSPESDTDDWAEPSAALARRSRCEEILRTTALGCRYIKQKDHYYPVVGCSALEALVNG